MTEINTLNIEMYSLNCFRPRLSTDVFDMFALRSSRHLQWMPATQECFTHENLLLALPSFRHMHAWTHLWIYFQVHNRFLCLQAAKHSKAGWRRCIPGHMWIIPPSLHATHPLAVKTHGWTWACYITLLHMAANVLTLCSYKAHT